MAVGMRLPPLRPGPQDPEFPHLKGTCAEAHVLAESSKTVHQGEPPFKAEYLEVQSPRKCRLARSWHIRGGLMPKVAKPRKHGSGWQINYTDGTGKRRYRTFPSHKEAVAALRRLATEADAVRSGSTPVVQQGKTFDELADLWLEVKHRKRSLSDDKSRLRVHLRPAFGRLKLVEITPARISRFERDLSKRLSTGTVRLVLALLRSSLNLAVEGLVARIDRRSDLRPRPTIYTARTDKGAPSARSLLRMAHPSSASLS